LAADNKGLPILKRYAYDFPDYGQKWITSPSAAKIVAKSADGIAIIRAIANVDNWS
jgi:hypothetical protein